MMTTTHQAVVALVEVVVVVIQVTHRHHTLAVVLVYLAVDTIRLDAADVGVVLVACLVGHELHHLILDAVALSLLCRLLHVRAMFAQLLVLLLIGRAPAVLILRQQAVHHRVGIAADGRRKVGVIFEGQTIVPDVVGRILRLHHSAQGNGLDEFLLLLALTVVHQRIQRTRDGSLRAGGLHLVAELDHKLTQRLQLRGVGLIVDAVDESLLGFWLLAFGFWLFRLPDMLGDGAVGQQHELLDELRGVVALLEVGAGGLAILVDVEMQFLAVELHSPALKAALTQTFCQPVKGFKVKVNSEK